MKNLIALFASLAFTVSAYATHTPEHKGDHPCAKLHEACKAAGYVKGAHKSNGKGMVLDCMKPLLEGKSVEGVTASAEDIAACKSKRESFKDKK